MAAIQRLPNKVNIEVKLRHRKRLIFYIKINSYVYPKKQIIFNQSELDLEICMYINQCILFT